MNLRIDTVDPGGRGLVPEGSTTWTRDEAFGYAAQPSGLVGEPVRRPNDRLHAARVQRLSPSGSGRCLSRQELADLVNAQLAACGFRHAVLDGTYIGKLERGEHRWPQSAYRSAFRAVLGASKDADLGFFIVRRQRS